MRRALIAATSLLLSAVLFSAFVVPASSEPVAAHSPPAKAETSKEIPVSVSVDGNGTTVQNIKLFCKPVNETVFFPVQMRHDGAGAWSGSIPAQTSAGVVEYYFDISYMDSQGQNSSLQLTDNGSAFSLTVEQGWPDVSTWGISIMIGVALLFGAYYIFMYPAWKRAKDQRPPLDDIEDEDENKAAAENPAQQPPPQEPPSQEKTGGAAINGKEPARKIEVVSGDEKGRR